MSRAIPVRDREDYKRAMRGADHDEMALELIARSVAWVLPLVDLRTRLTEPSTLAATAV
jgi:hypothetical protein